MLFFQGDSVAETVFIDGALGNFEVVEKTKREGPGEYGVAVQVGDQPIKHGDDCVKEWGFNECASAKIAMDRAIPDTRPLE